MRLPLPSIIQNFSLVYKATIVSLVVFGALFIKFSLDQEILAVEKTISNTAAQIEHITTYDIDYVRYQLTYAAKQISAMNGDKNKIQKLLSAFTNTINSQSEIALTWNAFSWIDDKNMLVVDGSSGILSRPINLSDRDYLQHTKNNPDKIIFGRPLYGALSQRFIIPAGMGVASNRGVYMGTLVFGFDIEKITTKLEKSLDDEAINFVFFENNKYLFSSKEFCTDSLPLVEEFLNKTNIDDNFHKKVISKPNFFSKKPIIIIYKIKDYPLEFALLYNKTSLNQKLIATTLQNLFIILLIISCSILLFNNIRRKIVDPVANLSQFSHKLLQKDFTCEIDQREIKDLRELHNALLRLKDLLKTEEELIDQLKLANQKSTQENFNKSEFLLSISHEIRAPLAAIISFAGFLRNQPSIKSAETIIKDIEVCATDSLHFINDLIDISQMSSGKFSVDLSKKIDVNDVIKRSINLNKDFAARRNIKIVNHVQHNVPPINLDRRRLKQILVNLISNSIKYSQEYTNIDINLSAHNNKLQIFIKDNGFGMTDSQIKIALTKYGTIDNENSSKVDSFGLGLPLVKHLVELQGGHMKIMSTPNIGTEIILSFNY